MYCTLFRPACWIFAATVHALLKTIVYCRLLHRPCALSKIRNVSDRLLQRPCACRKPRFSGFCPPQTVKQTHIQDFLLALTLLKKLNLPGCLLAYTYIQKSAHSPGRSFHLPNCQTDTHSRLFTFSCNFEKLTFRTASFSPDCQTCRSTVKSKDIGLLQSTEQLLKKIQDCFHHSCETHAYSSSLTCTCTVK